MNFGHTGIQVIYIYTRYPIAAAECDTAVVSDILTI